MVKWLKKKKPKTGKEACNMWLNNQVLPAGDSLQI